MNLKHSHRSPRIAHESFVYAANDDGESGLRAPAVTSENEGSSVENVKKGIPQDESEHVMKVKFFNPDELSESSANSPLASSKVIENGSASRVGEQNSDSYSSGEEGSSYSSSTSVNAGKEKGSYDGAASASSTPNMNEKNATSSTEETSSKASESFLQVPAGDEFHSASSNDSTHARTPSLTTSSVISGDNDFISEHAVDFLACSHPAHVIHRKFE